MLDPGILGKLRNVGGDALVEQLFRLYLTHTPPRVERVRQGLAAGDLDGVARAIHSLRSSSATVGALALASRLQEAEAAAESRAAAVGELWPPIQGEVEKLLADLERRLEGP